MASSTTTDAPPREPGETTAASPLLARVLPVVLAPASAAVVLGVVMPRGPMTTGQSVVALLVALAVGAAAGALSRSRWAALGAPVVYALLFEVVRLGTDGPTVDRIRFDSIFATGAMIAGRGFDLLVILAPMAVAALLGAAWARRRAGADGGSRAWRVVRRTGLTVATLSVVVLAAALVRPASTEAILGPDGGPLAGSVAELITIEVGGHDQSLVIRGTDVEAPVLLFLEGGPGGTAVGSMRYAGEPLEQDFVVATWDQRGTGRSADQLAPVETMTVDQVVADAVEVIDYLRERFDEERVYLVGSSWGSTLGVLVAQQRPDLLHAYVGTGQMVSQAATDQIMYDESLAYATSSGDEAFAQTLRDIGRPPYDDPLAYPLALSSNPEWHDFTPAPDSDWRASYPANVFVAEYTLTEQVRAIAGLYETFAVLYPQLLGIDFRRDVPRLEVPVLLVQGAYEADGRAVLAEEWFAGLEAPSKELVMCDHSGHTPHLDEPGRFAELMGELGETTYPG
ncbi:alpha/beta hydrolase [Cellulomonas sp. APG4]|uniref:alpha/beta fold hydrolase n=1 Tax=Cellulomonas sp. APG4 TaxID=1538656 RepID=UPI00137B7FB0|nr:alpha/beta hydrolase [Cellulomonas sp. APG4]NCT90487.1 alpha/beta hydrolase [Cellulomonas sp. APG4]